MTSPGTTAPDTAEATGPRRSIWPLVALAVILLLAGVVSGFASGSPDGLEAVAERHGFADSAEESPLAASPVADYAVAGVDSERLSGGLAGALGVGVTLGGTLALTRLLRMRRPGRSPGDGAARG